MVECADCGRSKKPIGRSSPLEMSLCDDECDGYRKDPYPDCRWPGEESCGPGCMRGVRDDEDQVRAEGKGERGR
jgi:hypothetical protein